jgi:hypothetical protein
VFENKVPRRDGVTGRRKKYIIMNIISSHFLLIKVRKIKSRRMRWAGYVARMEEKPEGYRPPWIYTLVWERNIKINIK